MGTHQMGKYVAGARSEAATVARAASATVSGIPAGHDSSTLEVAPGAVAATAAVTGVGAESRVLWRVLDVLASGDAGTRLKARDGTESPA